MIRVDLLDTIAAIASPPGPGLLGMIRIAGPGAEKVASAGWSPSPGSPTVQPGRRSGLFEIARLGRSIPGSITNWPGSKTVVGQPLAEIQASGSAPILQALLSHFLDHGARLAEPGEFTLRSFLAGRIDLTQAEAVMGVVDATNPGQLDAALRQLAGGLTSPIRDLRDRVVATLAHLEANLDFAEEPDVSPLGRRDLAEGLARAADEVSDLATRLASRTRASGHPRVVLSGPPNAGKSRLFNALVGMDRAIVSGEAGTTRDYVEAITQVDGLNIMIVDTAGLDDAPGIIADSARAGRSEQLAIADLRLDCRSIEETTLQQVDPSRTRDDPSAIVVLTKADLSDQARLDPLSGPIATSASTGYGLERLKGLIVRRLRENAEGSSEAVLATSVRCSEGLSASARSLGDAAEAIRLGLGDELVAVDLRRAIDDLGRVVGLIFTDDILDKIFRQFCIGK